MTKKSPKQEMKHESPTRGMEMDEIWLWVKKEIKEELEKDMMSANFESDILMQGVMMKEEIEVDAKRTQTCSNLQVAKRRRLTGGDMQKIMRAEAAEDPRCPSSVKKELADGVNVKKEPFACDMQIMQEAVNHKDLEADSFASIAATWAKQCLAFRSSKTWSPTRPCCPANLFLGSAIGRPSPPPTDAPACVLRLTGHGLRCLQRFHEKHSFAAFETEAPQPSPAMPPDPAVNRVRCNVQDYKVRGLDCMKMWPWMRDLPTSVWAGHGWAYDENGLRRLSSSGGSDVMQGVEVFESVGLAEEEVKPSGGKIKETPAAVAAAENPPPSEEQKPNKFARNNIAKQSGVAGVLWNRSAFAWEVQIPKSDSKGKRIGKTNRTFSVKKFIGPGISEAQADAAALAAAKAFRAELVEKGILSEPRQKDPNFTSEVPGVSWYKNYKKWVVLIRPKGGKKVIHGGYFTEKAAAEAKALELREKDGLQRRVKPVATLSELPVFHPKVPYRGVKWDVGEQLWHARFRAENGHFRVRPKDHSEAELERSFQVAVAWKKKQEKEKQSNAMNQ